jgi:hypothetical protein
MVWNLQGTSNLFDLSFLYSRECNLRCPFCMYSSGPEVKDRLSLSALYDFIQTIPMDRINSFGFYGGEPTMFLNENAGIMGWLPQDKPKFMISNGYWSRDQHDATIVKWYAKHFGFKVFVSSTAAHQRVQNAEILAKFCERYPEQFEIKAAETEFLPMGRLAGRPIACSQRCDWDTRPLRLAVQPDGSVIFQTCDGSYPIAGHIDHGFPRIAARIEGMRIAGFESHCPHYQKPIIATLAA